MSTNATLRNNLAKRGTNILCGNIVNKEKELITVQKKTSIINQNALNGNSNFNSNSVNNQSSNLTNNGKNAVFSKLDANRKIQNTKKENNENDKNANNTFLKRKTTIDFDNINAKKSINNNSLLNVNTNNEKEHLTLKISVKNQNIISENNDTAMNVSMKETNKKQPMSENTEMATEEANTTGYVMTNNTQNNDLPKTHRNPAVDFKRSSLPLASETSQIITKSLLHGEIKKRPIIANNNNNNAGNNSNLIAGNCEEFAFENINAENLNANSNMISNIPNTKSNSLANNNNNLNNNKNNISNGANIIQNVSSINSNNNNGNNNKLNFKSLISGISLNNSGTLQNIPASLYSFNLENISITKENLPKFTNEEYRRMFTRLIRKDLGRSYINNLFLEEEQLDDFLLPHKVTERMRTRMIDWMIEVLTNYKCDDNTFFLAVNTMDRYFKGFNVNNLQPSELHLLGVTSMFMASKYEDIYPLRLKIVHEKIAHKKLSCQEIKEKETDISVNLGFILGKPTQWEFINFFIEEIFFTQVNNFAVQDKTLNGNYGTAMGSVSNSNNSNIMQSFSQYETEIFKNYTANMINLLRHVVVYLAKMNCHDYCLSGKKPSLIAASTIFVAMKICEQINKEEYVNEYFSKKLTEISQKNENEIIKTAQKILYNAQNFDSIFTGLENLKKIHFNAIIDLKNTK